jgi:hypothetical protein
MLNGFGRHFLHQVIVLMNHNVDTPEMQPASAKATNNAKLSIIKCPVQTSNLQTQSCKKNTYTIAAGGSSFILVAHNYGSLTILRVEKHSPLVLISALSYP